MNIYVSTIVVSALVKDCSFVVFYHEEQLSTNFHLLHREEVEEMIDRGYEVEHARISHSVGHLPDGEVIFGQSVIVRMVREDKKDETLNLPLGGDGSWELIPRSARESLINQIIDHLEWQVI